MSKIFCFLGLHVWALLKAIEESHMDKETQSFLAVCYSTYACTKCGKERSIQTILQQF